MIREIFVQLKRFRSSLQRSVRAPVAVSPLRERASEVPVGSANSGSANVVAQTTYHATTGRTSHLFMLDVDGLDSQDAELS